MSQNPASVACGLSQEEFEQFQTQLLQIREEKYQSDAIRVKTQQRCVELEQRMKELQESILRTKNGKEVERLRLENVALRDRLSGIEESFELQVSTLREECRHLMQENDEIQKKLEQYQKMAREITVVSSTEEGSIPENCSQNEKSITCGQCDEFKKQSLTHLVRTEDLEKQLEEQVRLYNEKQQELEQCQKNYTSQIDDLRQQHTEELSRVTEEHKQTLKTLEDSVETLQTELRQFQETRELERKESEVKVNFLQKELEAALNNLEEEKAKKQVDMKQLKEDTEKEYDTLKAEMEEKMSLMSGNLKEAQEQITTFQSQVEELKRQLITASHEHEIALNQLSQKSEKECASLRELLSAQLAEKQSEVDHIRIIQQETVTRLEAEIDKWRQAEKNAQGEIKATRRKSERQLRDLRKELDRELRRSEQLQAQVVENALGPRSRQSLEDYLNCSVTVNQAQLVAAAASANQQQYGSPTTNSPLPSSSSMLAGNTTQMPFSNSLLAGANGGDDVSSVLSYSAALPLASTAGVGGCISEEDFSGVLDRLASVQEENCDLKRQLKILRDDMKQTEEQLQRKDSIIQRYLSGSGGPGQQLSSPEHLVARTSEDGMLLVSSSGLTSSATNGDCNSSGVSSTSTSGTPASATQLLHHSLGKVLDHLTTKRIESVEFRQMKNLCEELMTRNLHLENSLQTMADRNLILETSLKTKKDVS